MINKKEQAKHLQEAAPFCRHIDDVILERQPSGNGTHRADIENWLNPVLLTQETGYPTSAYGCGTWLQQDLTLLCR